MSTKRKKISEGTRISTQTGMNIAQTTQPKKTILDLPSTTTHAYNKRKLPTLTKVPSYGNTKRVVYDITQNNKRTVSSIEKLQRSPKNFAIKITNAHGPTGLNVTGLNKFMHVNGAHHFPNRPDFWPA